MLFETKTLLQNGVEEKRKGNFSKAIMFYKKAIEIEPDTNTPILYISLAKTQYLTGDLSDAVDNYMRSLYYSIIEIADRIDENRLSDVHYRVSILHQFFNTLIHLSHAHVKKDNDISDFYLILKERGHHVSHDILYQIINYLSNRYAYDLASGGIAYEPKTPQVFLDYKHIDWNELFFIKGLQIADSNINWDSVSMLVVMNKGMNI